MKHLFIFLTLLTCTYSNFIINPYVIAVPEPELPTANLYAHYQPSGISRHGFSVNTGTAQLDTAEKKVGVSSLLLDGNSDYVSYSDNVDWNMGTTATGEMWIRLNTAGTDMTMISQVQDASNYWEFKLTNSATRLQFNTGLGGDDVSMIAVWTPSADTWYHLAWTLNAGFNKLWIDGVDTTLIVNDPGIVGMGNITGDVEIGANSGADFFDGWIDDLMLTDSVKYTTNFTPAQPLTVTADSKLYMAFEGTDASTRIFDRALSTSGCSLWVDETLNKYDVIQTTGANQPIGTASALDGHTGLTFDGSNDFLDSTTAPSVWKFLHDGSPYTIFFIVKVNDSLLAGGIMGTGPAGSSTASFALRPLMDAEGHTGSINLFTSKAVVGQFIFNLYTTDDTWTPDVYHYGMVSFELSRTGNDLISETDESDSGGAEPSNLPNSGLNPPIPLRIGALQGAPGNPLDGVIVEIAIYNVALSTALIDQFNAYKNFKYPSLP